MRNENRKNLGQFWLRCPFQCGIDSYVTTETDQGVTLILCERFEIQWDDDGFSGVDIEYIPIKLQDLGVFKRL